MSQKREMPENIRKMFEQKNMQSNNFSEQQNQEEKPEISQKEPQVEPKSTVESLPQEQQTEKIPSAIQKENKVQKLPKIPKVKQEKQEKDNVKKSKKKLSKKSKIIIIIALLVVIITLAIVLPIVIKKKSEDNLPAPVLKVYALSNQTILYVDENKNATSYSFNWIESGTEGAVSQGTTSWNNKIVLNTLFDLGEYDVWAKYITSDGKESKASETVKVTYTKQLEKVEIKEIKNNILTFSNISNASRYKLFYDGSNYIDLPSQNVLGDIKVNLKELFEQNNIEPNVYNLYIQAIGNKATYYTDSELSSSKEYTYENKLDKIVSATYTKSTNILELNINENEYLSNYFQISILFSDVSTKDLIISFENLQSQMSVDLEQSISSYGKGSQDIREIKIITYSENKYIKNSDSVNAIIVD